MKGRMLVAIALCLVMPAVPAAEPDEGTAAWQIARLELIKRGKLVLRGYALYMTDASSPAVGFTCQRKKVYTFVSVVPLSLGDMLAKGFRNPAEWKAHYQIDSDAARDEKWIWTYGGKVFMSLPGEPSSYYFKAARRGADLVFQRKGGDPVNINIPTGDKQLIDRFIKKCGLTGTEFDAVTGEATSYKAARRSGVPTSAQRPS